MDSLFQFSEGDRRAAFLQQISHSFGCTFICLWTYLHPPSNCLMYMDGVYHEDNIKQPIASSSSGSSLALRLFNEYQKSVFVVDDNRHTPGFAFKHNLPYIEFNELELLTLASNDTQLQFYQEARIKKAVFMGCEVGEIEIGMSTDTQVDLETQMRNLFPQYFSRQAVAVPRELPQPTDQNIMSSSSSSLRSLSVDNSPDQGTTFLYNIMSTSYVPQQLIEPFLQSTMSGPLESSVANPFQEAIQTFSQIRNAQFPSIESEDAAITQAILAVISSSDSPASSSTSSHQRPQQKSSAFKSYVKSSLSPRRSQITSRLITHRRQNMLKSAISFIRRSSSLMSGQEQMQTGIRPMSSRLHHTIAERRRREQLNESFEALRALLPPGSKKDKASVLGRTTEYLDSLKTEIEELTKRNQNLEARLLQQNEKSKQETSVNIVSSSTERLQVQATNVSETISGARVVDLRVILRGEPYLLDLAIRVLEFLKTLGNVGVLSIDGDTRMEDTTSVCEVIWRLRIEGTDWDEVTFQETVRRVIADMAQ